MEKKIVFIAPNEGYTGYTSFVTLGTSTSDVTSGFIVKQGDVFPPNERPFESGKNESVIPESREGHFIDESLLKFYKKKGYRLSECP